MKNDNLRRVMLRVTVDKEKFPQYMEVEEGEFMGTYEVTGLAYVQDSRVMVEYALRHIFMKPARKMN